MASAISKGDEAISILILHRFEVSYRRGNPTTLWRSILYDEEWIHLNQILHSWSRCNHSLIVTTYKSEVADYFMKKLNEMSGS